MQHSDTNSPSSGIEDTGPIVIIGGGIAGLTTAIALVNAGEKVCVLEKSEVIEDFGAGMQLGPNAAGILCKLGLMPYLKPYVFTPHGVAIHDGLSGKLLTRMPLGMTIEKRHGAPYWVVHRGDLQNALLRRLEDLRRDYPDRVRIELGYPFDMYKLENDRVCVLPEKGEPLCGKALIGADGLWSKVRRQVTGTLPEPEFSGKTAWRALVDTKNLPLGVWRSYTGLWMAPNAHFVHYPVRDSTLLNIVAIISDEWRDEVWAAPGDAREVLSHFKKWSNEPQRLLGRADTWTKWPLFQKPKAAKWPINAGPVALIGDAVHPVLPFLAQGAALAIEDAAELAHLFKTRKNLPVHEILRIFASKRTPRINKVQALSAQMGTIYHLPAPTRFIRDTVLRLRSREGTLVSLDWLYGYKIED